MMAGLLDFIRRNRNDAETAAQQKEVAEWIAGLPDADRKALRDALAAGETAATPANAATESGAGAAQEQNAQQQTAGQQNAGAAANQQNANTTAANGVAPSASSETQTAAGQAAGSGGANARPPANAQSGMSVDSLATMSAAQINAMWDKGDIHRMFNQTPPPKPGVPN